MEYTTTNILNIYSINTSSQITFEEANDKIKYFNIISKKTDEKITKLNKKLDKSDPENLNRIKINTHHLINKELQKWSHHIKRLGGHPISLFKIKLQTNSGTYIWEYPNSSITLMH